MIVEAPEEYNIYTYLDKNNLLVGERMTGSWDADPYEVSSEVKVYSSDESVISVENINKDSLTFEIVGKAEGTASVVFERANGTTQTEEITVSGTYVPVEQINLPENSIVMRIGDSKEFNVELLPENSSIRKAEQIGENANNIVKLNESVLTAIGAGHAKMHFKADDAEADLDVIVVPRTSGTAITLDKTSAELNVNEELQLHATILPEDAVNKSVEWSSSDESIATVDENGKVKVIKAGTVKIFATTAFGLLVSETEVIVKDSTPGPTPETTPEPTPESGEDYTGFKYADGTTPQLLPTNGMLYWFEDGVKQGVYGDPLNIFDTNHGKLERGREIYDPSSKGWYWLDACFEGAIARRKEVWMPYIFQEDLKTGANPDGKWVRYDAYGCMVKGWYANDNGVYYYDLNTGAMYKGAHVINGKAHYFDEMTGVMIN